MTFEKIGPQHLERKAILYVRQSSAHQVLHNRESSALQYAMRDRVGRLVIINHGFELAAPDPPFASLSQRPTRTAYRSMRPVYPSRHLDRLQKPSRFRPSPPPRAGF